MSGQPATPAGVAGSDDQPCVCHAATAEVTGVTVGIVVTCLHCGRPPVTFTVRARRAMDVEYDPATHGACAASDEPGRSLKECGIDIR